MLLFFLIVLVITIPVCTAIQQAADNAPDIRVSAGPVKVDKSPEVWGVMMGAYTKIRRAGVSCHPWISACVEAIERGRECPVDIAILAVQKTLSEIAGTRYEKMVASDLEAAVESLKRI